MRTLRWIPAAAFFTLAAGLAFQPAGMAEEKPALDGKKLFVETHKCSMCHAVPAAEIEAKVKTGPMKGADLGGKLEKRIEEVAAYVRKKSEIDGAQHKKEFKGSDEELQAILDWLGSLEAQK